MVNEFVNLYTGMLTIALSIFFNERFTHPKKKKKKYSLIRLIYNIFDNILFFIFFINGVKFY